MTVRFRFVDRVKVLFGYRVTTCVEATINSSLIVVKKEEVAIIHKPKKEKK